MSVGGGFKKGKAEFAMKDVDGNDIKTATQSFGYVDGDKVLSVNGIDINSTENQYGLYFKDGEYENNIYSDTGTLVFNGPSLFNGNVQVVELSDVDGISRSDSDKQLLYLSTNNQGYARWQKLNPVHCWQFRKGSANLFIYLADETGNTQISNIYTYLEDAPNNDEFNLRVNKVVNIHGNFSSPYSGYSLVNYTIERGPSDHGGVVDILLTLIKRDSSGAMDVANIRQEMNSTSYQNGDIKLIF